MDETNKLKKENDNLKTSNADLSHQVAEINASYSKYKKECDEAKERLMAVQKILEEEQKTMAIVEKRLLDALANFNKNGIEVNQKNGMIYVSLEEGLMYKSGSITLGADARKALGSLAKVLNDYPRLKVIVVGNTDSILSKKGSDNWTLSTERANGVVRILRDDYQVEPSRLTAAGKGKYAPVADNSTPEGRAKNRRTEIILNPDLDRIWDEAAKEKK
jgi:chemotaxis protein MotB